METTILNKHKCKECKWFDGCKCLEPERNRINEEKGWNYYRNFRKMPSEPACKRFEGMKEIVIKISDSLYEECKRMGDMNDELFEAIRKGTVYRKENDMTVKDVSNYISDCVVMDKCENCKYGLVSNNKWTKKEKNGKIVIQNGTSIDCQKKNLKSIKFIDDEMFCSEYEEKENEQ